MLRVYVSVRLCVNKINKFSNACSKLKNPINENKVRIHIGLGVINNLLIIVFCCIGKNVFVFRLKGSEPRSRMY